jgi:excinuclease ABC subunit A
MAHNWIAVRGARVHNLRNVDVDLPRDRLVVITGLSGSGKSSLAFDTVYAEGQRRYVESLSAYARQFLEQMEKPDVDLIDGLSPAISIEQKTTGSNPRSTVGTVTEIYDYLRSAVRKRRRPALPELRPRNHVAVARAHHGHGACSFRPMSASTCWRRSCAAARASSSVNWRRCGAKGFTRARIDGQFVALETIPSWIAARITCDRRPGRSVDRPDRIVERRLSDSVDLAAQARRRNRRHQHAERRRSAVLAPPRVPVMRHQHSGNDAARVFVQLAARRVPGVSGTGIGVRLRSGRGCAPDDRMSLPRARSCRGPRVTAVD